MRRELLMCHIKQQGFSLVEIVLSIALFGLFATALIGLLFASLDSDVQAEEKEIAVQYAEEGIEAVWSIRREAFNQLESGEYGLDNSSGSWNFSGSSDLIDDIFTRVISISDVCRDSGGAIADCDDIDAEIDIRTKQASSTVTYTAVTGVENEVSLVSYVTAWQDETWRQTDWSGGSGQAEWSSDSRYNTDSGTITTAVAGEVALASSGSESWPFTTENNYTYDAGIEVTGGLAQLAPIGGGCSGTATACTSLITQPTCSAQSGCSWSAAMQNSTTNSGFTVNGAGWTYADWNQGGGEVDVTGTYVALGGNTGGFVNVSFPAGRNDELGGYWQQSFTTTSLNPTATMNFDWLVSAYGATPNTFQLYVFVDSVAGAPTIGSHVWTSGPISSTSSWNSVTSLNVSSKLSAIGTYYLKAAVWVETPNKLTGPLTIGYDNVSLTWSNGVGSCSGTALACGSVSSELSCSSQAGCSWSSPTYSTVEPSIESDTSISVPSITSWSSFTESAVKNGGEIYYQLSFNGSSWRWWNGSTWSAAQSGEYNTASVVDANISSFPTTQDQIYFRAFLVSDGTQQVQLDSVTVGWDGGGSSGFETSGWLISSAFDMGAQASVHTIDWTETIPACSGTCLVQLQVRTAPDVAGAPGTWSSWYGASGAGTYFTDPSGELISTDLNFGQWVQYRAELQGDGTASPTLEEVAITYLP